MLCAETLLKVNRFRGCMHSGHTRHAACTVNRYYRLVSDCCSSGYTHEQLVFRVLGAMRGGTGGPAGREAAQESSLARVLVPAGCLVEVSSTLSRTSLPPAPDPWFSDKAKTGPSLPTLAGSKDHAYLSESGMNISAAPCGPQQVWS